MDDISGSRSVDVGWRCCSIAAAADDDDDEVEERSNALALESIIASKYFFTICVPVSIKSLISAWYSFHSPWIEERMYCDICTPRDAPMLFNRVVEMTLFNAWHVCVRALMSTSRP